LTTGNVQVFFFCTQRGAYRKISPAAEVIPSPANLKNFARDVNVIVRGSVMIAMKVSTLYLLSLFFDEFF
jgi:hypothetical protein